MSPSAMSRGVPANSLKPQKRILVVEDEFLIRWTLSEELREVGFHVIEACDAVEALSVLKTITPDLIISDVRMPGPFDGLELLGMVKKSTPELPVIIISGHLSSAQAVLEGATDFLAKPYSAMEMRAAVDRALGNAL